MRVSLVNETEGLFCGVDTNVIGEFAVPVASIMIHSERPQFFNLLNEDGKSIERTYSRKNHYELSSLINLIIAISHSEDHHPEITFGYNIARVKYFTYAIDGLSENDFICAAKIDKVLAI